MSGRGQLDIVDGFPAPASQQYTTRPPNAVSVLGRRRRRGPSTETALGGGVVFCCRGIQDSGTVTWIDEGSPTLPAESCQR